MPTLPHDAIILSGGRGQRLGGVDKGRVELHGRSLLNRALEAAEAADNLVVVGPPDPSRTDLHWVREDPPGGGPTAGIVAGMQALAQLDDLHSESTAGWILLLAVDQPGAAEAVPTLLKAAGEAAVEVDAVCPHDERGHAQWLLAAYRSDSLLRACKKVGSGHDISVRRLVGDLRFADVPLAAQHVGDVDSWADHQAWQARLER